MGGVFERVCEVDVTGGLVTIGRKIVRCKDCKHFNGVSACNRWVDIFEAEEIALQVTPDGFCFWGAVA